MPMLNWLQLYILNELKYSKDTRVFVWFIPSVVYILYDHRDFLARWKRTVRIACHYYYDSGGDQVHKRMVLKWENNEDGYLNRARK